MKMKPFYQDSGVGHKLTGQMTQILTATSTYLMVGYIICRNVNSKRQVFSSHILNKVYQITCLWKTQEQHSSWDEKLFAAEYTFASSFAN